MLFYIGIIPPHWMHCDWSTSSRRLIPTIKLFRSPLDPERQAIKRIIGLEGDVIRTRHPYPQKIIVVPKGQIWVEGDEAFHSLDSNTFGPIPIALVTAKVTHTLFPLRRVGTVSYDEKLARRGALVAASGRRQATQ
jgi:signal peptidase I